MRESSEQDPAPVDMGTDVERSGDSFRPGYRVSRPQRSPTRSRGLFQPPPRGRHAAPEDRTRDRSRSRGGFFIELPVLVLVAFVLALLLKTFLVQAFYIPSESMLPTLAEDDRVLVNKLAHLFREPERGEVIVFSQGNGVTGAETSDNPLIRTLQSVAGGLGFMQTGDKDFIKRIMGLPGETLEMRDGVVLIDGEPIPEETFEHGGYLSRPDMVDFGPLTIPEGEYFLMGDNRPNSLDSRSTLSTIPAEDIVGRAFTIVWPLDRMTILSIADYGVGAAADPAARVEAGPSGR